MAGLPASCYTLPLPFFFNANLPPILHRFRHTAFDRSKVAIFGQWAPLLRQPSPFLAEGVPGDDLRKSIPVCQWMTKVPNGVKYYRKFQPAE